ncbi:MAG: helix-turn-helix domain-containing protein, partial [Kiritimatiellota bacterium]|nr:helix-turn-helix domain-containing protein [Kiritimatiellota bacterium]
MESIGQILKAARERRQISIADVVGATKMTSTFVKAIEANDFDVLVAPVYARGFIKLYAECVGLDPMPLLKQFDVSSRGAPVLAPPPSEAPPRKQEKIGGRSKAVNPATPLRVGVQAPIPGLLPSWLASLLAERLSALNSLFSVRVQWPRFKLPDMALPVIVWRRIFIVAGVVLLIITASLAWDWSHRGLPSTTDAGRWLAEPPAPYLAMESRPASPHG